MQSTVQSVQSRVQSSKIASRKILSVVCTKQSTEYRARAKQSTERSQQKVPEQKPTSMSTYVCVVVMAMMAWLVGQTLLQLDCQEFPQAFSRDSDSPRDPKGFPKESLGIPRGIP